MYEGFWSSSLVLSSSCALACSACQRRLWESVSRLLCLQADPVPSKEGVLRVLTRRRDGSTSILGPQGGKEGGSGRGCGLVVVILGECGTLLSLLLDQRRFEERIDITVGEYRQGGSEGRPGWWVECVVGVVVGGGGG